MDLKTLFMSLVAIAIGLGILVAFISVLTARSALRKGALPDEVAAGTRGKLIEAVKDASPERGTRVALSGFWRGSGATASQRFYLLKPLLDRGILRAPQSTDSVERFFETLWRDILHRPPGQVILNERDWLKMAQGTPGIQIGDVHGIVQIGNSNDASQTNEGTKLADVAQLVRALRQDAPRNTPSDADELESLADSLEIDLRQGRWQQVDLGVSRIAKIAETSGKVLDATLKALSLFS